MPFTNIRQGAFTKVAVAFQATQGTPFVSWTNDHIIRADEAPAPDPGIEIVDNQGTTGTLYALDTAVIVSTTPGISATLKASSALIRLLVESCLGVTPTTEAGPIGTIYIYEGFNAQIPDDRYATYVWDDGYETLRVVDAWFHTINLTSAAREAAKIEVTGIGRDIEKLNESVLAGLNLVNLHSYAHKDSIFYDELTGTPVPLAIINLNIQIEHGRTIVNANSVSPTFFGKDGRIAVTGSLSARLYDDTAPLLDRVLNLTRATYRGRWVQDDGKTLEIILRNVRLSGTYPSVGADGTMADLSLNFVAAQTGTDTWPITIRVED